MLCIVKEVDLRVNVDEVLFLIRMEKRFVSFWVIVVICFIKLILLKWFVKEMYCFLMWM